MFSVIVECLRVLDCLTAQRHTDESSAAVDLSSQSLDDLYMYALPLQRKGGGVGGGGLLVGRAVEFLSALSSGLLYTSGLSQCWAL